MVLPAASFAEVSGTLTNLEGRDQHFEPVIPPVGDSRPDWWITCQVAHAMGLDGFAFEKAAQVWEEITNSEWRVACGELQVASGELQEAGDPQTTSDQQLANINPQSKIKNLKSTINNPQFPFTLIVERNQFSYRGSALTRRVHGMEQYKADEGLVLLNPKDAFALKLREGETARVSSEHGSDLLVVQVTSDLPELTAFTSINSAFGSALFPGKLPEVKAYAVKIERSVD